MGYSSAQVGDPVCSLKWTCVTFAIPVTWDIATVYSLFVKTSNSGRLLVDPPKLAQEQSFHSPCQYP